MDDLLDEALETLTLMFAELVQATRALPRITETGEALIQRARVIGAIVSVGVALRRLRGRAARGGVQGVRDQLETAQAHVRAAQARVAQVG